MIPFYFHGRRWGEWMAMAFEEPSKPVAQGGFKSGIFDFAEIRKRMDEIGVDPFRNKEFPEMGTTQPSAPTKPETETPAPDWSYCGQNDPGDCCD